MNTAYTIAFWSSLILLIAGSALGLSGVWVEGWWNSDVYGKLLTTNIILFVTALAITIITRFLR
jgi:hypothetical protein